MKETYTVQLVAKNPIAKNALVQIDMQPEGAGANPRPIPANEDERQVQKMFEAQTEMNPFFQQMMLQTPKPRTMLIITVEQYEALGKPAVGDRLILSVSREGDHTDP